MEKLLLLIALINKFKAGRTFYQNWNLNNPGILTTKDLQGLLSRIAEIDLITDRINKIMLALNFKKEFYPDAELRKKDTEIQKIIDTLDVERFKIIQADETDLNNYEFF